MQRNLEPERLPFWQGGGHEIDFVLGGASFVEAKRGRASPIGFAWFPKSLPRGDLTVVCAAPLATDRMCGQTPHAFLASG